jgi:hypothetical protein
MSVRMQLEEKIETTEDPVIQQELQYLLERKEHRQQVEKEKETNFTNSLPTRFIVLFTVLLGFVCIGIFLMVWLWLGEFVQAIGQSM